MTPKERAIQIIEGSFGDDLERAIKFFKHFTPDEMKELHGESGKTRQQIIDGFIKDREERIEALLWVRQQN